jgi:ribosomal protein S18 acetylase RimI-like enzyme
MSIEFSTEIEAIDWEQLAVVFERAPLGPRQPELLEQSFRNSQVRCFAYDAGQIVGAGRALTDWISWTVVFDLVLVPELQGLGHGRSMMRMLGERANAKNIMLHASPGKEAFYERLGFRRMKTAMALFGNAERAEALGYIE